MMKRDSDGRSSDSGDSESLRIIADVPPVCTKPAGAQGQPWVEIPLRLSFLLCKMGGESSAFKDTIDTHTIDTQMLHFLSVPLPRIWPGRQACTSKRVAPWSSGLVDWLLSGGFLDSSLG